MKRRIVQIVTTHDFFGSYSPLPTSYGHLGGGHGLREAVNRRRRQASTVWLDSGDFSHGGFREDSSDNALLLAVGELGVDAAVVGNHEFDRGAEYLRVHADRLGFPLLCANAAVDLPATTLLQVPEGVIGVIGITHHNIQSMAAWSVDNRHDMPLSYRLLDDTVEQHSAELRRQGADMVIAIIHEGADWTFDPIGNYQTDPSRLIDLCSWHDAIDLIVAGHTLGRFEGRIGSTPIVQPWPLGSEICAVTVDLGDPRNPVSIEFEPVSPGGPWMGLGSDDITAAADDIVAVLAKPYTARSGAPSPPLAQLIADAIAAESDAAQAYGYVTCGQPTIDGNFAHLPAGPVSRLQLHQIVPYTDHRIFEAFVSREEARELEKLTGPRPQTRTTGWARSQAMQNSSDNVRIAVLSGASPRLFADLLGRPLEWTESGGNMITGLKKVLKRP